MLDDAFAFRLDDDAASLVLAGQVDELAFEAFREALDMVTAGITRSAMIDLTAVTLLPSLVIAALATTSKRQTDAGLELRLVAAEGSIAAAVLRVCGVRYTTSAAPGVPNTKAVELRPPTVMRSVATES